MTNRAKLLLTEASFLPAELPVNFTFNKVRELLDGLEAYEAGELEAAIAAAKRQQISGPLASVIFIKHHLAGAHEVEIDRVEESEAGASYAVLVYAEGEVPIKVENLPESVSAGTQLHYDPGTGQYGI